MAILKILQDTEPDLKKVSRPVEKINKRIITLLDDMRDTAIDANGIGLAAPQVGVFRCVAIIEIEEGELIEMINPEIIYRKGEQEKIEGCLSSPGKYAKTKRPMTVTVRYMNRNGETVEKSGSELLARAFCHEIDHLSGITCYDNALEILTAEEVQKLRETAGEDADI